MKINSINPLSFQKKLIATATIGQNENPQDVKIFLLEEGDYKYFSEKLKSHIWQDSHSEYKKRTLDSFWWDYVYSADEGRSDYLVMESDGEIINYAMTDYNKSGKSRKVYYIETAPFYKTGKNRKYRYAGETMLACIVNLAKKKEKPAERVELFYEPSAKDFYTQQCGFEADDDCAYLDKTNYDRMLETNVQHINYSLNMCV